MNKYHQAFPENIFRKVSLIVSESFRTDIFLLFTQEPKPCSVKHPKDWAIMTNPNMSHRPPQRESKSF